MIDSTTFALLLSKSLSQAQIETEILSLEPSSKHKGQAKLVARLANQTVSLSVTPQGLHLAVPTMTHFEPFSGSIQTFLTLAIVLISSLLGGAP